MASDRIARSRYTLTQGSWDPSPTGDHITLPLDPAQYDDAAVEAADKAYWTIIVSNEPSPSFDMRAAIAAYARHVAGGGA